MSVLALRNLSKSCGTGPTEARALSGIDLSVDAGSSSVRAGANHTHECGLTPTVHATPIPSAYLRHPCASFDQAQER
jgi:hypothetical protein